MAKTRSFILSDILSITTGILVSRRRVDGVYDILDFMTGVNLFTHQLPAAIRTCGPILLQQHPDLADVTVPDLGGSPDQAAVGRWLDGVEAQYGAHRMVTAMPPGSYNPGGVIDTLLRMLGNGAQ